MIAVDFETFPIEGRPDYPPVPVGVALQQYGAGRGVYLAWGHPTGNNTTKAQAVRKLKEVFSSGEDLIMHNAPFDCDVAQSLGVRLPSWEKIHDTVLLLFLDNPHAQDYHLKESCERLFDRASTERDRVGEWLIEHQPVEGTRITQKMKTAKYTAYAPGGLVAKYAVGDVSRTLQLFRKLHGPVTSEMGEAYNRERRMWAGVRRMEERGLRVDVPALRRDVAMYDAEWERLDEHLRRRLKAPDLNFNAGQQLAEALIRAGFATEESLGTTEKGNLRTSRDAIEEGVKDKRLVACLSYRGQLKTCVTTFLRPWLEKAERTGGLIYCKWRPYRQDGGGGARTGRLSSSPNFQNMPKDFSGKEVKPPMKWLSPIPQVRKYVKPLEKGHVLFGRDYSQQELRILAHVAGGPLQAAYLENPWLDFHDTARKMINAATGASWERKQVKNTGFGLLYGMGEGALADAISDTVTVARDLKRAYLNTFPGIKELYAECRRRAHADPEEPIWTWGERRYFCEEPRWIKGRMRRFDYKLVNVIIQGSAGDQMKEAMCRYFEAGYDEDAPILISVHDELLGSCPADDLHRSMDRLRETMDGVEMSVPLLSEGHWSKFNWGRLSTYDKKGKVVCRKR